MKELIVNGLVLVSASGLSVAAGSSPVELAPDAGAVEHVAHIYYNIATGEKITTLLADQDAQRPVDGTEGLEIWIQDIGQQCIDYGYTTEFYYVMDDPDDTASLHEYLFDWGEMSFDTVVDCVQIHWLTNHQDSDSDSDMQADGVVGFAGTWTYWDGLNGGDGAEFDCIASPLISLQFHNLPGELTDPSGSSIALYTADIDLGTAGDGGSSLVFEIGDTDSDLQGASVHNNGIGVFFYYDAGIPGATFGDPNANGLANWGWSLIYDQPGTVDVDNADGDNDRETGIDGDLNALASAGVVFGAPNPGHPEFDSVSDSWSWVSDGPTAGLTYDLFASAHVDGSSIITDGSFYFGGLDCSVGEQSYVPAAMFQTVLYGPFDGGPGCDTPADLNSDGELDFFDISFFLTNMVDYNGDTVFDFFDISVFLADFGAGCP